MTVGITGATGQLGRRVIEALKARMPATDIVALVRSPAKAAGLGVARGTPSIAKALVRRQMETSVRPHAAPGAGGRPGHLVLDDGPRPIAIAALRASLDLGMTHIETAEMYGEAELVVATRSKTGPRRFS